MAYLRAKFGLTAAAAILTAAAAGCVDAPITADQLREDGALRPGIVHNPEQSAFSAVERPKAARRAAQISAVLAKVGSGPLSDQSSFEAGIDSVHLHLRADGLQGPRDIVFRWTHEASGEAVSVRSTLVPADTLRHVAAHAIAPGQSGAWTVEVLDGSASLDGEADVLWQRRFEVAAG